MEKYDYTSIMCKCQKRMLFHWEKEENYKFESEDVNHIRLFIVTL